MAEIRRTKHQGTKAEADMLPKIQAISYASTATTDKIAERRSQTYTLLTQYLHRAQSFRPQSFKQTRTHLQELEQL